MRLGYARVSSAGQSLDIQLEALKEAGCERIFAEKQSGTSMDGREELHGLLTMLRPGDEVHATRLDRLARSVTDFLRIALLIDEKGATLHIIQQAIETKSPVGRMCATFIAAVAQFETELRKERQREGIAKALATHKYKGRPRGPSYDRAVIQHMLEKQGLTPRKVAKQLKCTEWTVRRAMREIELAKLKEVLQ